MTAEDLVGIQAALAVEMPARWRPTGSESIGGCFVCFGRGESGPGRVGDLGWAGAALWRRGELIATANVEGEAGFGYEPGLLALREGPLLDAAVRALPRMPDVLLVDATGRDHPRRAGLALHLGAVLGVPTVGVTHRLLVATGAFPEAREGAASPFVAHGEVAGYWLRTRADARPLAIHAAWRTDPATAVDVVLACTGSESRTPEPLRKARQAAREARAAAHASGKPPPVPFR